MYRAFLRECAALLNVIVVQSASISFGWRGSGSFPSSGGSQKRINSHKISNLFAAHTIQAMSHANAHNTSMAVEYVGVVGLVG